MLAHKIQACSLITSGCNLILIRLWLKKFNQNSIQCILWAYSSCYYCLVASTASQIFKERRVKMPLTCLHNTYVYMQYICIYTYIYMHDLKFINLSYISKFKRAQRISIKPIVIRQFIETHCIKSVISFMHKIKNYQNEIQISLIQLTVTNCDHLDRTGAHFPL